MGYNEMLNFLTQSTASDITLVSMIHVGKIHFLAFMIHDDITGWMAEDQLEDLSFIAEAMVSIPWVYIHSSPLTKAYVPLQVECSVGDDWGSQSELFKVDALEFGLDTIEKAVERGTDMMIKINQRAEAGLDTWCRE